ncbi:tRNA wybutosine-synthesizing protein 4-like, partial [Tigriopus californicus]
MEDGQGIQWVELTNVEAQRSKLSLVKKGYRHDVFLERLFQILGLDEQYAGVRSSAIDQGYLLRAIAMEATFERTLIQWSRSQKPFQVLNLGAGFDLSYFRLTNAGLLNPELCHYFEVDLPAVIRDKSLVIRSHPIFHAMWRTPGQRIHDHCYKFQNLALLGCDLNDIPSLERQLNQCGFDWSKLTLVVSECALTYVPEQSVSGLFTYLLQKLQQCELVIYEQILPDDSFGRIMCNHFQTRDTPLLNVAHFPTPDDHIRRFYALGLLGPMQCTPLTEFLDCHFTLGEQIQRQKSDPSLDEFEELILKCQHYVVLTASHDRRNVDPDPHCLPKESILAPSSKDTKVIPAVFI